MKIISKFKDYYDISLSYGVDNKNIYLRNNESFIYNKNKLNNFTSTYYLPIKKENKDFSLALFSIFSRIHDYIDNKVIIGFCGKLYITYKVKIIDEKFNKKIDEKYCFSEEEIRNYLKINNINYDEVFSRFDKEKITESFKEFKNKEDNDLFTEIKAPIFSISKLTIDEIVVEKNCNLKELEFHKIFDAYQAYQEIEMYNSNVLMLNEPETINIEDKYKIEGKGFDTKYGFRKRPSK